MESMLGLVLAGFVMGDSIVRGLTLWGSVSLGGEGSCIGGLGWWLASAFRHLDNGLRCALSGDRQGAGFMFTVVSSGACNGVSIMVMSLVVGGVLLS